ncbi:hypothetical protein [Frankia sp. CcI49]|uniref:hypothetical protein n=1 Tax=Frankia sp. CcI49 TaxID=1745382 RepID=UPI0010568875|nr:hypothetical protein [Frankia sp. CcI49]
MAVRDLFRLSEYAPGEGRGGPSAVRDVAGKPAPSALGRRPRQLPSKRHGLFLAVIAFTVSSCSGDVAARPETAVTSGAASPGPATSAPRVLGLWPEDFVLTEDLATTYFSGVPAETDTAAVQPGKRYPPEFADCLGLSATDLNYEPEATAVGAIFVSDDGDSFISSYAEIVTEKQAAAVRAMWANPRFADCSGRETQARIDESGADPDGLEYQLAGVQRPPAPTGAAGYLRVTLQVREQEFTYDMAVDNLVFIVDHVAVTVTYTNYEPAPPMDRLQLIADQISGKLAQQQLRPIAGRPTSAGTGLQAAGKADPSTVLPAVA